MEWGIKNDEFKLEEFKFDDEESSEEGQLAPKKESKLSDGHEELNGGVIQKIDFKDLWNEINFEVDTISHNRPIVGVRLKHTKTTEIYCVIGVHLADEMEIADYQNAMNDVLKNIKYNQSEEKILIMGDHNELYTLLENEERENIKLMNGKINVKLKNKEPHKGTCCSSVLNTSSNPRNSNKYNKKYDLVYSNIDNISIDVEKVTHSDHLPLVGSFIIGEKVSEDDILEKEIKTAVAIAATALKEEEE